MQLEAVNLKDYCWAAGKPEGLEDSMNSIVPASQLSGFQATNSSGQFLKHLFEYF
jgi:hypothetical protein